MEAYKMVDIAFADKFESGEQIKIDTFSAYRQMDGARKDVSEGVAINKVGHYQVTGRANDSELAALRSMGIFQDRLTVGTRISDSISTNSLSDMYVFCASSEPDHERANEFGCAIFHISDFDRFAGRVRSALFNAFGPFTIGKIQYGPRIGNPFETGPMTANPFMKSSDFAWENEIRAVWQIKGRRQGPIFAIPSVRHLIKRIC